MCLGQRVLALSVEGKQLELVVKLFVVDTFPAAPGQRTTFCRGEILHGVETERSEVGHRTNLLAVPSRTEGMGSISTYDDTIESLLNVIAWTEEMLLALHNPENLVVVAGNAGQVNGNYYFGALGNDIGQLVVVHFVGTRLGVNQHQPGTHMTNHACRSRVGIGRSDDLVAFSNAENPQHRLQTGRC